jgi:hypothetical protein
MRSSLDAGELRRAEASLFARWRRRYRQNDKTFLPDGAMPCFVGERFRLLFVLKEGNDPDGGFVDGGGDLRAAWKWGHDRRHTWRRLAAWAALILDGVETVPSKDVTGTVLRRIACINLKKTPGHAAADPRQIHLAARNDASFIREQIGLYMPSLVICCGKPVFSALQHDVYGVVDRDRFCFEDEDGDDQFFFRLSGGAPVMDFWHPAIRARGMTQAVLLRRLRSNLQYLAGLSLISNPGVIN